LTPTLDTPMQNSLLWVYEGLTRYLGAVLAVRSGLHTFDEALGNFAQNADAMQMREGRRWRPLRDTTNHSIYAEGPQPWPNWQRGSDYYLEGQLIWLDADTLLRELTGGRRTLDDFVRAMFAVEDHAQRPLAYRFEDVVAALETLAPYDWEGFLTQRVDAVAPGAPLDGIRRGGYELAYRDQPTSFFRAGERQRGVSDLSSSIGLTVKDDGTVADVRWESPAFAAALTIGTRVLAVGDRAFTPQVLLDAVRACKGRTEPLRLTVRRGERVDVRGIDCSTGLRYPWLVRGESSRAGRTPAATSLEAIFAPLTR
jgi:predicted metalloprotease with PDZ domain